MDYSNIINSLMATLGEYLPKIAGAIVALIIGFWIIGKVTSMVRKTMEARDFDPSLAKFLVALLGGILKIALLISVAGIVGIDVTSLAVILGAAGLAIGMALQGSLSNFAGGVMLLIFKPVKVDELITAQGHTGVVQEVGLFVTTLLTPDNKTVFLPNGPLSNGDITNFSRDGKLRVELVIGIGYGEDIKKARDVIMQSMNANPKVLQTPAPSVNVLELGDSSVNLAVRPWATVADYWDVYFEVQENAKEALDAAGIEIPFPQRVIHNA